MAATLAEYQKVVLVSPDAESRAAIAANPALPEPASRLQVIDCPADDIWARDFGPVTVLVGEHRRFIDFRFDGWCGRYPADRDDRMTARLYQAGALGIGEIMHDACVLEGGSIDTNGDGALLTTRRCLLDNARNRDAAEAGFEALFRRRLGIDKVHWLAHGGLAGDDTDGHIDTLARFVAPDTIVYQGCDDKADSHYEPLAAMAEELRALRDRHGRPYRLQSLPLPAAVHDPGDGRRLPAGYANFLIANGCVLVPAYDDPADAQAAATLQQCFPDRRIVSIDCRALIRHNGALHCAAMQLPAHG